MADDLNLAQAATEVRKLVRQVQAVDVIASALERVSGLANAEKESLSRIAVVRADVAAAEADLAKVLAAIEDHKAQAASVLETARENAKVTMRNARAGAEDLRATAEAELAAARVRVDLLNAEHDLVTKTVAERKTELSRVEDAINNAKERVNLFLNGGSIEQK